MNSIVTLIIFSYIAGIFIYWSIGEPTLDNFIKCFGWPVKLYQDWKAKQ